MPKVIGIDIGSLYTKVAIFESPTKLHIEDLFYFPTPYATTVTDKKVDNDHLIKELKKKVPIRELKEAKIGLSIPFSAPVVMTLALPRMSKKELEVAAITEARRKMIPAPGPKSTFETVHLGEIIENKITKQEMLIVREEKDFIDGTLRLLKDLETIPRMLAPTCTTYASLLARSQKSKEAAFIDIGYSSMNISVFKGVHVIFNRNIFFGCKDIISGVANGLGVSDQEAEKLLFEYGIPDVAFDPRNRVAIAEEIMRKKYEAHSEKEIPSDVYKLEMRMFLEPFLERIIQEIRRTFIYFKERFDSRQIDEIYFLGGGALLKNIVSLVGKKISPFPKYFDLNIAPHIGVAENIETSDQSLFIGALSLALDAAVKTHKTINFLPVEYKKREERALKRSLFTGTCIITICLFSLGWLNFWILSMTTKRALKRVDFQLNRLKDVYDKEQALTNKMKMVKQRQELVEKLIQGRVDLLPVIIAITPKRVGNYIYTKLYIGPERRTQQENASGEEISLANVASLGEREWVLELHVSILADYEEAYSTIEEVVQRVENSGFFSGVEVQSPELAAIVPTVENETVTLTKVTWRKFIITAQANL